MRFIFLIFTSFIVIFASCNAKKPATNAQTTENPAPDTLVVVMKEKEVSKDSLALQFERTACYGRCPIYKIKAYRSGFVTFEGINFTEKLGFYATRVDLDFLQNIFKEAEKIGYFKLDAEYNNKNITDLPSVVSMIDMNGKKNRIVARTDVPEKLQEFHKFVDQTFMSLDWTNYNDR